MTASIANISMHGSWCLCQLADVTTVCCVQGEDGTPGSKGLPGLPGMKGQNVSMMK